MSRSAGRKSSSQALSQSVTPPASFIGSATRMIAGSPFGMKAPIIMRSAVNSAIGGNGGIREDRGLPRYVAWEPRPRRVGAKKGRENSRA